MRRHLQRFLPDRDQIHRNRWLAWLGPRLLHPRLWHFSRRGVAVGVGLGVFFGLLIPIAQIPLSAASAVLLRANVPVAVGSTLVTNPVTFAPIYLFAHHLGSALLGEPETTAAEAAPRPAVDRETGWWRTAWENILGLGKPLLLGLSILAVTGSLLTYGVIMLFWRLKTSWNWKRRRRESPLGR
jgi:uncharacterized protein (DUF2062 family)